MRLNQVNQLPRDRKRPKRVGRGTGSGHGKTSGRGHKGQLSRAGAGGRVTFAGGQTPFFRQLPKRGFSNSRFRAEFAIVNVRELNCFEAGSEVDPEALRARRLVRRRDAPVKIVGDGEINVPLKVTAHRFSRAAAEKIRAAGGEVVTA